MGLERRPVRRAEGLRFAKLLGTGDGRTFTPRDADPRHWGLLACWDAPADAARFAAGATHRRWDALAEERLDVAMVPIASRGSWSGHEPFGTPPAGRPGAGPVASITRARIRARHQRSFWAAVPDVSQDLHAGDGLLLALGIGEAPIGLQGTFSLWRDAAALTDFAYRRHAHTEVVRRTATTPWFAEDLFARFAVTGVRGRFGGRELMIETSPTAPEA
jgi:hypothetical protein